MSQEAIRKVLRANADGLTATELARNLSLERRCVVLSIKKMADVYIDRWLTKPGLGKRAGQAFTYYPIYIAIDIPQNSPRPD